MLLSLILSIQPPAIAQDYVAEPIAQSVTKNSSSSYLDHQKVPYFPVINLHEKADIAAIRDILSVDDSNLPQKFRLEARIKGYSPMNLSDWVVAICSKCKTRYDGSFTSCLL